MTTTHDTIELVSGDTWTLSGVLEDSNGDPLDMTDAAIEWKLDTVDGRTNVLALSLGSGVSYLDIEAATIWIEAIPDQTKTVQAGAYYDWLTVTLGTGEVFTEWTGVIKVVGKPAEPKLA